MEDLARAIAGESYKAGAVYVDGVISDPYLKRARVKHTVDERALGFIPSWPGQRLLDQGERRAARISLAGPTAPGLLNGLDPKRAGRIRPPGQKEVMQVINANTTNWTIVPSPTEPWAQKVYPDLSPAEATQELWESVIKMCRLDAQDPIEAWHQRHDFLDKVASRLTRQQFDSLHFKGPGPDGTDLTVGLLPSSRWLSARSTTVGGITHMANWPTEELYTTPDPARVEGRARATKPLDLGGIIVRDFCVVFEKGWAVLVKAAEGEEALKQHIKKRGASRLGEVALVDGDGRIGPMDTVFYTTLIDENAASHIALGDAYEEPVSHKDYPNINRSDIHNDFMIGAPDVCVTGIRSDGERVPVLLEGVWQI